MVKGRKISYPLILVLASLAIFLISFYVIPKYLVPSAYEMSYSLIFFVLSSYFLGYSLTKDVFDSEDSLELHVIRLGFGLACLPILFVVMGPVGVPLRWNIIFALAGLRPLYDLFTSPNLKLPRVSVGRYGAYSCIIFAVAFTLALYGAYQYPYLEDGDPWEHALGAKYISLFNKYTQGDGLNFAHYLSPYPPTYDTLMGLTHQLNSSISWTLKSFNALLVALSYLFAYFLVKRLSGDERAGFFAALILFMLPPFGSHTIWSHTLSVALVFPVFYAMSMVGSGKHWVIISALLLGSSLITQPLMSLVMGVFAALYALARVLADKGVLRDFAVVCVLGLAVSMVFWAVAYQSPFFRSANGLGADSSDGAVVMGLTEGEKMPTAWLFFFPENHGDIFMHQGLGLFAVALAFVTVDMALRNNPLKYFKKNPWVLSTTLWLCFSLFFLFSAGFSITFHPARFWGIAAIPLGMLGGYSLANVDKIKFIPKKHARTAFMILVAGLVVTSLWPKVIVQTSRWSSSLTYLAGDNMAYSEMIKLAPNTLVYPLCNIDAYVIGYDKLSLSWDPEIYNSRKDPMSHNPITLHTLLSSRGYKWVIADPQCARKCVDDGDGTSADCSSMFEKTLERLENSGLFKITTRSKDNFIIKIL